MSRDTPEPRGAIVGGWAEQKVIREIMLFLHSNGVGTSRAVRIYKTYGADAVQLISENPYRLARDIRGIGFRTADQIAGKLGIEKTALIRVRAGIAYALTEAMDEGHCGLPAEELISLTQTLLEVPAELVETALGLELEGGAVIADDLEGRRCVFLAGLYRAEREIAEDTDRGRPCRACLEGAGDHRRAWRRQDNLGQLDPQDPCCEDHRNRAMCADGPRRQTPVREHRARGEDDPPPARNRPQDRSFPAQRGGAARL